MAVKEITCACCPHHCKISVEVEMEKIVRIYDNGCIRGEVYAENEVKKDFKKE